MGLVTWNSVKCVKLKVIYLETFAYLTTEKDETRADPIVWCFHLCPMPGSDIKKDTSDNQR